MPADTHDLDRIDRRLIAAVQADAAASAERLSATVALSPSAITRRLKRLRADGWLAVTATAPGRRLVEGRLHCLVHVAMHDHDEAKGIAALRERLAAMPEVQMLLDCAGDTDLTLLLSVRDMAAFNAFAAEQLESDPAVRRYETTVVRRVHKHTLAEPIAIER